MFNIELKFGQALLPAIHFWSIVHTIPVCEGLVVGKNGEVAATEECAKFEDAVNYSVQLFFCRGPSSLDVGELLRDEANRMGFAIDVLDEVTT